MEAVANHETESAAANEGSGATPSADEQLEEPSADVKDKEAA